MKGGEEVMPKKLGPRDGTRRTVVEVLDSKREPVDRVAARVVRPSPRWHGLLVKADTITPKEADFEHDIPLFQTKPYELREPSGDMKGLVGKRIGVFVIGIVSFLLLLALFGLHLRLGGAASWSPR